MEKAMVCELIPGDTEQWVDKRENGMKKAGPQDTGL